MNKPIKMLSVINISCNENTLNGKVIAREGEEVSDVQTSAMWQESGAAKLKAVQICETCRKRSDKAKLSDTAHLQGYDRSVSQRFMDISEKSHPIINYYNYYKSFYKSQHRSLTDMQTASTTLQRET